MDPWYIRWNVPLAALLCIIIWALSYYAFHAAEGAPRLLWVLGGVAVAVAYLVVFSPRRRP